MRNRYAFFILTSILLTIHSVSGEKPLGEKPKVKVAEFSDLGLENKSFIFNPDLNCSEVRSTDSSRKKVEITFMDLDTEKPQVLSGGVTFGMKRGAETEEVITIFGLTASGSMSTYIINKKTGTYSHAAVGKVIYLYASCSIGVCKGVQ